MSIQSINPATGELLQSFNSHSWADVSLTLADVQDAQRTWNKITLFERKRLMYAAAKVLRDGAPVYARMMTLEMGKPIRQSFAEVEKCAWVCEYYADNAEGFLQFEPVPTDARESYVRFDPLGVVLAVMPWNFPLWQVFRFAAPALMAGNAAVLKHASNVFGCALLIEEVFVKAGFPANVFRTLLIGSSLVDDVIGHPAIAAVTLTGSDGAGRAVAACAGTHLKKTVLELGGSDPFIVLADADIEKSAATAATARLINSGQSCIAAKRFIVVREIMDAFRERFVAAIAEQKMGDPFDEHTDVGPLARPDLVDDLERQVNESVALGAKILTGGRRGEGPGAYYLPTVLGDVLPGMPAFDEETFGPVAALVEAKDESEAIEWANRSQFGLGASVWTGDIEKARDIAAQIEAGAVFVNGLVKSDPRLPFGGVKTSGYGRELSHYGMREFLNIKSVWIG